MRGVELDVELLRLDWGFRARDETSVNSLFDSHKLMVLLFVHVPSSRTIDHIVFMKWSW